MPLFLFLVYLLPLLLSYSIASIMFNDIYMFDFFASFGKVAVAAVDNFMSVASISAFSIFLCLSSSLLDD